MKRLTGIAIMLASLFVLFDSSGRAAAAICKNGVPCVNSNDIINGQVANVDLADNAVNSAKVQDGTISGTDIQDSSVGSADLATGAVGSTQISDGSVSSTDVGFNFAGSTSKGGPATDLSCTACVSKSELDATVFPAQRIVVATGGGDYTSISAALAAITPSAVNPYVIEVMPGTYTENVSMKSYVHLRGAGREVTTVQAASSTLDVILLNSLTNVAISGFTLTGGREGIRTFGSSSVTITGNRVTANQTMGIGTWGGSTSVTISDNIASGNSWHGIHSNSSAPLITGNTVSNNVINGINNEVSGNPTVIGNTITGNGNVGVSNISSSPIISGNTITGNTDSGIANFSSSSPTITNNKITDHTAFDIRIDPSSSANISFNIYDDISDNGGGVGQYNVHSSGAANPAP